MERHEVFEIPAPIVTVKQVSGTITVVPSTDGRTSVRLSGSGKAAEELIATSQVERRGDQVLIVVAKQRRRFGRTVIIGRDYAVDIHLAVPPSASLQVATVSGHLTSTAPCTDARFSSVSGDVRIEGACTNAMLNTVSGDLTFHGTFSTMVAKSVSGDMTITTSGGSELTVSSVSGDIDIHVVPGMGIDIEAKSLSGDLRSDIALDQEPSRSGEPTLRIFGKTISGDLHVQRATTV